MRQVSEIIAEDGMMVTATHAALDDKTWAVTGPRLVLAINQTAAAAALIIDTHCPSLLLLP